MAHAEITTRAKFDTLAARGERARGRSSRRHHHARRAKPVEMMSAAHQGSARAQIGTMLKINAAPRNPPTLHPDRHSSCNHSPAQALARAIASATRLRTSFQLDTCFAGTHLVGSESGTRVPCAAPHMCARRERAWCGDPRRCRSFRATRRRSGLAAPALRHAASATATSERGCACMRAAMAAAHEI